MEKETSIVVVDIFAMVAGVNHCGDAVFAFENIDDSAEEVGGVLDGVVVCVYKIGGVCSADIEGSIEFESSESIWIAVDI